jgi:SAM-dependent methyltransferase
MNVPRETFGLTEIKHCPICNASQFEPYLTTKDFSTSQETFNIVKCTVCGFKFTNPIPAEDQIGKYYQFDDYISHTNKSGGLMGIAYRRVRARALKQKLKLIKEHVSNGNLLDIGCGTGFFAAAAKLAGYNVTGLEPDESARKFAISNNAVNALPAEELSSIKTKFDVITMWHVLEHVYHLNRDVEVISGLLAPNGVLIVAVPNCLSADAQHYKEHWAGYDVPRHLYHFTQPDLEKLFTPLGLTLAKVVPMKFDAYYVSMLSQKHLGKSKLSGLLKGVSSNRQARKGTSPWSSQIYIFTR